MVCEQRRMVETISSKLGYPFLVLGGTGNLGTALKKLVDNEAEALVPSRMELDLREEHYLLKYLDHHKPKVVINSAAWTDVEGAETHQIEASLLNIELPRILGIWCERNKSQLIHISTDYVFDGCKSTPYTEEDSTNPISVYGQTKASGENAVLEVSPKNFTIVRTSGLYGYTPRNFVVKMMKRALRKESVTVVSDQIMSPTSSIDLAEFCLTIAREDSHPHIIHFSNQGVTTWFEVTQMIYSSLEQELSLVTPILSQDFPSKVKRPMQSKLQTIYPQLSKEFNHDWRLSLKVFIDKVVKEHVELLH